MFWLALPQVLVLALILVCTHPSQAGEPSPKPGTPVSVINAQNADASKIYGKIQIVESFPDYKVQVVDSFPDLKVQVVSSFPDSAGKWQMVDSFPDYKIQFVSSGADFKIKYVSSFPGTD